MQVLIVLLVAFNLRGALVALSPVLDQVRRDADLSSSTAGLLITLPVVCFAAFSPVAPRLARRWGIERVLAVAMALLVGAVLVRLTPSAVALFLGTAVLGAAMAIGNVLLPALVKQGFPSRIGLMTGAYVTVMSAGATLAAGATIVMQQALQLSWRGVLALWALPAGAAMAACISGARFRRTGPDGIVPLTAVRGLYRDRLAWQVTLFMGLQSLTYYSSVAWLPTLFIDKGVSPADAGFLLGAMSLVSLPASLLAPVFAGRRATQTHLILLSSALTGTGLAGIVVAPVAVPFVWVLLLGLGQGAAIGLALAMMGLRAPDSDHAVQLSSMAQGVGYLIGAVGPFALGAVHELTGSWSLAFSVALVALAPQLLFGVGAARDLQVGAGASLKGTVILQTDDR